MDVYIKKSLNLKIYNYGADDGDDDDIDNDDGI